MGNKASSPSALSRPNEAKYNKAPQQSPPVIDHTLFSNEELKSVRLVALQGPFVDSKTAVLLSQFYAVHCPDNTDTEEKIATIIESGMEVKMLNDKLRLKYGKDLTDFRQGEIPSSAEI